MIIGIDGNEANCVRGDIGSRAGSNVVAFQTLWALHRISKSWEKKHKIIIYLADEPLNDLPPEDGDHFKYKVLGNSPFWLITKLMPKLLIGSKPDVFHQFSHYLPPFSNVPMGCTIHDLGYLKFSGQFKKKDYWQLKYWTAMSLNISKYIISVSKYTKRDLIKNFPETKEKIHVIHNSYDKQNIGKNHSVNDIQKIMNKFHIDSEYIFFLSTLKPSKNIEGVLRAFARIKKRGDIKLVVAGGRGWMYDQALGLVEELKLNEKVVFTGYVGETEKDILLQEAKLMVAPSHWEGFGIQVLESMACGTPVVLSDRASLTEIAGDSAIYVDPDSPQSIADGVEMIINMSPVEYNKLVKNGLERSKLFDWYKSAEKLISIFERVV